MKKARRQLEVYPEYSRCDNIVIVVARARHHDPYLQIGHHIWPIRAQLSPNKGIRAVDLTWSTSRWACRRPRIVTGTSKCIKYETRWTAQNSVSWWYLIRVTRTTRTYSIGDRFSTWTRRPCWMRTAGLEMSNILFSNWAYARMILIQFYSQFWQCLITSACTQISKQQKIGFAIGINKKEIIGRVNNAQNSSWYKLLHGCLLKISGCGIPWW